MASELGSPKISSLLITAAVSTFICIAGLGSVAYYLVSTGWMITPSDKSATPDPTLATKPRLPDDMRDVAQDATNHFKKQEYAEAAADYQRIIDKYPDSLYAWSNLGVAQFQQGQYEKARDTLLRSIQLSPDDAFSHVNLGISYYQLAQYDLATSELERSIALDPTSAKAYNYLGCCYSQKGYQKKAMAMFQKAIDLDSKFGDAYFNLSLLYATTKPPDVAQAQKYYLRAIDLGIPKDPRLEKLISKGGDSTH